MCCALKSTLLNVVLWVLTLIGLAPVTLGWVASIEEWIGYTSVDDAIVVTYKTVDDLDLWATVFKPTIQDEETVHPVVVLFHNKSTESPDDAIKFELCEQFASLGYVSISFEHRPATEDVLLEELIQDAQDAICWVRENASDLEVDLARIAVLGQSDEGFLATSSVFFPPAGDAPPRVSALLLHNPLLSVSADTYSPLEHIQQGGPPTLITVTGATSSTVVSDAEYFVAAMTDAGNVCDLRLFEPEDSLQEGQEGIEIVAIMHEFLIFAGF